ncbi:hypothetical protein EIQ10_22755 [Xanthomonas campestris pv. campestris]
MARLGTHADAPDNTASRASALLPTDCYRLHTREARMIVVDHAPADWFLLCDADDGYWLDVNCNRSATGFSILLALDAGERDTVVAHGHAACLQLAAQVQQCPRDFAARDISTLHGARVTAAVHAWRAAGSA